MKILSRAEEIILLAILHLEGEAYGISIRNFIRETVGSEWSLAQIYDPLNRLTHKGYVVKSKGSSLPERGGRHKCLYTITKDGKSALEEIRNLQSRLWSINAKGIKS